MKIVVIGGDAAGMSAASKAKRINKSAEVIVFEKGNYVSFAACGMPYYISGVVSDVQSLVHYPVEKFVIERGIDVRLGSEIISINPALKSVSVKKRDGTIVNEIYDKLIIASGASPKIPSFFKNYKNKYVLRWLEDAIKIKSETKNAKEVVIIGAGFVGIEMAEAFKISGKNVIMVEFLSRVLRGYDEEFGVEIIKTLTKNGINVRLNEEVTSVVADGTTIKSIKTKSGNEYHGDVFFISVGITPNVSFSQNTGISLYDDHGGKSDGAISVNDRMETSIPDIYAVGDCATTFDLITEKNIYYPSATTANKQGRVAGENAAGGHAVFKGVVRTDVIKIFDIEVGRVGLTVEEASYEGFQPVTKSIKAGTKANYYPGKKDIMVKFIADKKSHRLLGASLLGGEGVAKRIDIISEALMKKSTLEDMLNIDYSYSPPFAPVWEPLYIAAEVLLSKIMNGE
ncbi:MAG: FAD-dependent oxidoreductase [Candidatus Thermoplasmatota archaeon]|nr:FAD-dependent oxidoreductase [Candidatus Thermoplasmatota archaeon]MCL5963376.1 FAD-dependent oxidoreductase [Candidatus Thermoplasmatota archaeon]